MIIWFLLCGFCLLNLMAFIIAYVGLRMQFGKRIDKQEKAVPIPVWMRQKEVKFISGDNKLRGYFYWKEKSNKKLDRIIVLVHGYGLIHHDYRIEIEEFVKRQYCVFAYDMTGCGSSEGKKIGGFSQFILDAQNAIKYVSELNLNKEIDILGHSTGAFAVAALLNIDDLCVDRAIIISGFNHPSSYVKSCMERSLKKFSYFVQIWLYIIELIKFGKIARYTGINGINHFSGEVLDIQNMKDEMVTYTQSLYYEKNKILNDKACFWLNNENSHYPTRKKEGELDLINEDAFNIIENFLTKHKYLGS